MMRANMKKKTILIAILVALIVLPITGCRKADDNDESKYQADLVAFQLYMSGLVVAADQSSEIQNDMDIFKEVGLKCNIIKRSKGPEVVDALIGGSADFGTLANTPVVLQALQGGHLSIFATIQTTDHDIKMVGHKDQGVSSGTSLKGKRIGFVGGTIGEIFLERYLQKHGIDKKEVTLTSAGPAQLRDLFINKSLDAIIIWEPVIQDILTDEGVAKDDVYIDIDPSLYVLRMHLVAKPETLKQKHEETKRLVKAIIKGEELLIAHPQKVRKQLELWLDRKPGTLEKVFEESTFRVNLDIPSLLKELKEEAEWAQKSVFSGKGKMPEDFSIYIDPTILESVAPNRVIK